MREEPAPDHRPRITLALRSGYACCHTPRLRHASARWHPLRGLVKRGSPGMGNLERWSLLARMERSAMREEPAPISAAPFGLRLLWPRPPVIARLDRATQ
jgi:hypothetical protein